ncbi:MAG: hypothetical protein J6S67_22665 [Methanobrevibacter sp.]|nr:hypothetical protein [Methanobrevibacter sp.]
MANSTLKVLTRLVDIEDEKFVLVKITRIDTKDEFIGTIPYTELDEKGCMKRELNGFDMCLSDSIPHALEGRRDLILTKGMNEAQIINYFKNKFQRECQ